MNAIAINPEAAATLSSPMDDGGQKAPDTVAVIDTKPARQFRHLLEQTAGHDVLVTRARPALRDAAKQVFTVPVTVAFAAASLGIDLSVRGLDKEDTDARTWLQRLRVNLQRALNDAGLLKTDSGKGRKRAANSGSVAVTLDSILSTLHSLPPEELDKLAEAVAELLSEQLSKAA